MKKTETIMERNIVGVYVPNPPNNPIIPPRGGSALFEERREGVCDTPGNTSEHEVKT